MMQANQSITKFYDDAMANWHTLNQRIKKSGPVGDYTRPSYLLYGNFTTEPHMFTVVSRQI